MLETSFADRLASVEARIQAAVKQVGRQRSDVTLVAVSKKFSSTHIEMAYSCGARIFGENYVQEFAEKKPELTTLVGAEFHLIGHLQSNKSRLACELFDVVQTVDSVKLLKRLDVAAQETGRQVGIFLEVKLSSEEAKSGAEAESVPSILEASTHCPNLHVLGLMTIPPWSEDPEVSRPYFQQLAALAARHGLKQLSMGMSNDLEVAIQEGATIVRVGTALFGPRPKPAV